MKLYVCKLKTILKLAAVVCGAAALLPLFGLVGRSAVGAFTENRDLPIYSVQSEEKIAALTFDCAWGDSDIPSILETLKKEDVKATFFMVGQWAEKYPESAGIIAAGGHDIGNHSYSHLRMGSLGKDKIREEIEKCGSKLMELTNTEMELFRAPYGDYNNTVVSVARGLGYYTIQWDVDTINIVSLL